jgi:hypothetical protein
MRKKIIIVVLLLLALVPVTFLLLKGKRFEVNITQEQIDQTLAETFPMSKRYLLIFNVTYQNPEVTLLPERNRIQIGLDAVVNVKVNDEPIELGGGATVSTSIRYDPDTQEFFLSDVQLERLDIQGVPESLNLRVTNLALQAAQDFIETPPVYKLEGTDAKMATAKMLLKNFEVRDRNIVVTLGI